MQLGTCSRIIAFPFFDGGPADSLQRSAPTSRIANRQRFLTTDEVSYAHSHRRRSHHLLAMFDRKAIEHLEASKNRALFAGCDEHRSRNRASNNFGALSSDSTGNRRTESITTNCSLPMAMRKPSCLLLVSAPTLQLKSDVWVCAAIMWTRLSSP